MERKLNILIVDDQPDVADILGKLIETDGHSVTVTYDGREALKVSQDKRFDIVFTDISMDGLSGIALTEYLIGQDSEALVIAITGHIGNDEINQALKAGAKAFLRKPFRKKEIDEVIEKLRNSL
jgi:CheY-like chemotaxis protein